jgi:nitrate/TMAO reductase-like tetraheme cytochrome c subunit
MPRYIADQYELPDDDSLDSGIAYGRRRPRLAGIWLLAVAALLVAIGSAASALAVSERQERDDFCLSCHTPQHRAYVERAAAAVAGALALDLSSYHYQQIYGQDQIIRCIDCHRGDGGVRHRAQVMLLSAELTARWLAGQDDRRLEKTAITTTLVNGLTQTAPMTSLALRAPELSNAGCVACHKSELLIAGMDNHMHNTLPAAYTLWRYGEPLVAPKEAPDPQALIAQGLALYPTSVQCSSCHQTHRAMDAAQFLDLQAVVKPACERCHREVGRGPEEVTIQEE